LQLDRSGPKGNRPTKITTPYLHHPSQASHHRDGDVIPWVKVAHIDFLRGDDQPSVAGFGRKVDETKADHCATRRHQGEVYPAVQIPQEQLGIEVLVPNLTDPVHSPSTESIDNGAEFLTRSGQHIRNLAFLIAPLDNALASSRATAWTAGSETSSARHDEGR
jgi:hypothetical protein